MKNKYPLLIFWNFCIWNPGLSAIAYLFSHSPPALLLDDFWEISFYILFFTTSHPFCPGNGASSLAFWIRIPFLLLIGCRIGEMKSCISSVIVNEGKGDFEKKHLDNFVL